MDCKKQMKSVFTVFQEARVKIEKGGSLKLSKDVVTRLQSEFDQSQDQEASLQTHSDPSPSARRLLTRRDSLISKFFSRKKSEKEIRTFSGQFPPPPAFSDPSPAPLTPTKEEEHIYSVPQLTPPPRPQSSRTSLSQLHLLRSRENVKISNSSATLEPNLKTFLSKPSRSPPTNTKKCTADNDSTPAFEKCHDRISMSGPSSPKSVTFLQESEPTSNTGGNRLRPERRALPQRGRHARLRSPPSKRSLKYSSLSSASPSSSPTSGILKC